MRPGIGQRTTRAVVLPGRTAQDEVQVTFSVSPPSTTSSMPVT
jgi:hypothetical protein